MFKLIKLTAFLLCFSLCVPLLMAQFDEKFDSICGFRKISRTPKIINGNDAFHGQYPWAISLRLHRRHHCGGALINHNFVLTAAHCVAQIGPRAFSVKLGGHYRNPEHEPASVEVGVSRVLAHENFSFSSFANDIALIKLAKSVEYTNYVTPICLPQTDNTEYANQTGIVIGWGKLTPNGLSATSLQQVSLPIIDNTKCIKWYESQGKLIPIRSSQFCAGLEEGGKDACQGDSGSPMMKIDQQSGQAMAIGIVSAGIGCALPKLPGLYTRIASYIPWIKKNIMELSAPEVKPTTVKPSVPEPSKGFNSSLPIWTIPANNHSVIIIHMPSINQTHHNHNHNNTHIHTQLIIQKLTTIAPTTTTTNITTTATPVSTTTTPVSSSTTKAPETTYTSSVSSSSQTTE